MSGGGSSTSSTKVELPEYAQPYAELLMSRAGQLADMQPQAYGGQQIAGLTGQHQAGLNMIQNRAQNGSQWNSMQGNVAQDMLGGSPIFMSGQPSASTATAQSGQAGFTAADNPYIIKGTPNATNTYVGGQSQGISGPGSVMGAAQAAQTSNPYLGGTTTPSAGTSQVSVGQNSLLGMNNPYLQEQIGAAQGDVTRSYLQTVQPQRDAQMRSSGSFGNAGVQQMQLEDQRNLQQNLGRVASDMRMQDYGLQAQLGEGNLSRQLAALQANASNLLQNNQFNSQLQAQDLNRNLMGAFTQQQFNAGQMLDAAKFDAGMQSNTQQFNAGLGAQDLARNAGLLQQLSMFNTGNQVDNVRQAQNLMQSQQQFNAGQANANSQFNAGLGAQQSQFNAGQRNNMSQFNTGLANQRQQTGLGIAQGLAQQPYQDAQMLLGVGDNLRDYQQTLLNQGQQNWQAQQNAPYQQLDVLSNAIRTLMGGGGTSTTSSSLPQVNRLASGMGGAAGGYALANMMGQGQYAPYAAGAGGLLGMF